MKPMSLLKGLTLALALTLVCNSAQATVKVGYKIGKGLNFESDDPVFKMNLYGRFQFRFTYNKLEQSPDNNTFAVQRGEILMNGHVLTEDLRYGFEMSLATRSTNSGVAQLNDFYLDYFPISYFGIKAGQFKVPFMYQELVSSGNLQFVERSHVNAFFDPVRDLGVNIHGNLFQKKMNYNVFAMNGDGINTIDTNQSLMMGARLEVVPLGEYQYSESDVDESEDPNLGFGLAYYYDRRNAALPGQSNITAPGARTHNATADVGFKYKGFSFQGMGALTRALSFTNGAITQTSLTNWGYSAQTGYFFVPKKFEVALKHGGAILSNTARNEYEYALGLNYFFAGHPIKLQGDYTLILNDRGQNLNDHRIRTQVQVIF